MIIKKIIILKGTTMGPVIRMAMVPFCTETIMISMVSYCRIWIRAWVWLVGNFVNFLECLPRYSCTLQDYVSEVQEVVKMTFLEHNWRSFFLRLNFARNGIEITAPRISLARIKICCFDITILGLHKNWIGGKKRFFLLE